ncbi:uncharacterized protein LOC123535900 [Mercenaria mercenaria]|uniref:uncharacterized protein LOC123535900 n=1 Tax=Mercenaria mercenaria TaxID=6596 RepID=UPI00234F4A9A|nr:uncharacterized protein LOC123535900 [Mercenaria mercenaria]
MVVEILEDKLDQDYVDYISDMIMKNASEELEQDSASADLDQAEDGSVMRYLKKYEDCPGNWEPMDERDVNRDGYVLVPLETESQDYQNVVLRFFDSMVDHSVEVTAVHRVQNPIQWKYYTVKKSEMLRDSGGFTSVVEGQLFHGTSSSAVEAICRKGFDWRLCGKHGTLYGQGSYFAVNASYSHQYTDLRRPHGALRSSMTFSQPTSMTLPTAPPLLFPPVNVNFGQPLHPISTPVGISVIQTSQYRPMNLSHNATTGTGSQSVVRQITQTGSQPQPSSSQNLSNNSGSSQFASSSNGSLTNPAQPGPSGSVGTSNSTHYMQNILNMPSSDITAKRKILLSKRKQLLSCSRRILPKPVAVRNVTGLASSPFGTAFETEEIERPKARVFFARVLVGKYTTGNPKLRKPPPLYMNSDQFGKCYDSCVDNEADPKIFVIFDSTQAYPEYLVEYTYSEDKLF